MPSVTVKGGGARVARSLQALAAVWCTDACTNRRCTVADRWRDPQTGRFGYENPNALLRRVLDARGRGVIFGGEAALGAEPVRVKSAAQRAAEIRAVLAAATGPTTDAGSAVPSLDELLRRIVAGTSPEEGAE